MAYLSTSELSDLRDHLEATLPDTCTIKYVSVTQTSMGSSEKSWTNRGTAIACRFAPLGGRGGSLFGLLAGQLREGQFWVLHIAYDQAIEVTDKVVIDEVTYQVLQVNAAESERFLKRVLLETEL